LPPTRLLLSTRTDTSNSERKEKVALDRQQFKQKREKEKRKMERVQKRRQEQRQMLQEKRETAIGIPILPESLLLLNNTKSPVLVRSKEYGFRKRGAEGCNNGGSSRCSRWRVEEKKSLARISDGKSYGSLDGGRSTTPTAFCNRHPRAKCQQFLWHTASQSANTHCLAW